ncbi:regulator of protease activity HflC (stomatin/prohibitin superfamily) [Agromyces terreus]|uniref:Regulator of protease activity HflC (Stomatin/prohibitin superfamily) n=1 Tax=Agromyces terreus TaxID=424795 RepID=A0A9X2GWV8_9MICO|nr:hypothetical protein [Agromyces terreus]MCP2370147.1 regulator of protease activity HflC (stomatin/prohibitin superfamily) [Agromyces terreus]
MTKSAEQARKAARREARRAVREAKRAAKRARKTGETLTREGRKRFAALTADAQADVRLAREMRKSRPHEAKRLAHRATRRLVGATTRAEASGEADERKRADAAAKHNATALALAAKQRRDASKKIGKWADSAAKAWQKGADAANAKR